MSIEKFHFALPEIYQSADEIAIDTKSDPDFIRTKIGLKGRYILGPEETGVSLSVKACENLFSENPDLKDEIDAVICITQNPDRRIPHNSAIIASQLNLPTRVAAFDLSLGCSGWIYGIHVAEGFLKSVGLENCLLITCDPYSKIIAKEDKDTNSIFGDAATVTLIKSSGNRSQTIGSIFGSDGSKGNSIEVIGGGASKPLILNDGSMISQLTRDELRLRMNGRAIFNFVMTKVSESIEECLIKTKLSKHEIDLYVLHQGSKYMLDSLAKNLSIPDSKLIQNIDKYGNTVSSSIPLILRELDEDKKLANKLVLISGFGVGLSWGTSIIKFNF